MLELGVKVGIRIGFRVRDADMPIGYEMPG